MTCPTRTTATLVALILGAAAALPAQGPLIALSPTSVNFTQQAGAGAAPSQTVAVTNAGGGTLSGLSSTVTYAAGEPTGWLKATKPTDQTVLTATAALGLLAGTYHATVAVRAKTASNSPQNVAVTFTVSGVAPHIALSSTELSFAGSPGGGVTADQTVEITNAGGGTLDRLARTVTYGAGEPTGWLTAPLSGSVAPATLTLHSNAPLTMAVGTYHATISVRSPAADNTPQLIAVTFAVAGAPPAIALAPASLGFTAVQGSGATATQSVAVTNAGDGALSGLSRAIIYAAGQPTGWLNAPLSANTAPASLAVRATASRSLPAGSYGATIEVRSARAGNTPQVVQVSFTVRPPGNTPPVATITSPSDGASFVEGAEVSFSGSATDAEDGPLGGSALTWTSSLNGPLGTGASLSRNDLSIGDHIIQLVARDADGSTATASVSISITAGSPVIAASPGSISLSVQQEQVAQGQIQITNAGTGVLRGLEAGTFNNYFNGQPAPWLSATFDSQTAPTTMTITAAPDASVPPGNSQYRFDVTAQGATNSPYTFFQINVTVIEKGVTPTGATIAFSPGNLSLTAAQGGSAQGDIAITNAGQGTLAGLAMGPVAGYYNGVPAPWVTGTFSSTTAPATLTLTAAPPADLPPGGYPLRFDLTSPGATNSPATFFNLFVTVAEGAPPQIAVAASATPPPATVQAGSSVSGTFDVTNAGGRTLSGLAVGPVTHLFSGQPIPWATVSLGSTTAPTELTLSLAPPADVTPGQYPLTFQVSAPDATNNPRDVTWGISVTGPGTGVIAVSRFEGSGTVAQGASTALTSQITNAGTGSITGLGATLRDYNTGQPLPWITPSFDAADAPATLTLTAAPGFDIEPRNYRVVLNVTGGNAQNSPFEVQLGFNVEAGTPPVTQLAVTAGHVHTCRVAADGAGSCWGDNSAGQLGTGSTAATLVPVPVSGALAFKMLALGYQHTCGLTPSGTAYCWGWNHDGAVGDGTTTQRNAPVQLSGGLTFETLGAGYDHTCGLTADGAAFCWGLNEQGDLGDGTTVRRLTATPVTGGVSFSSLHVGVHSACGLSSQGQAYCWGANTYGQLGDGTTTSRTSPVAVAGGLTFAALSAGLGEFFCGIAATGAAYCWGRNLGGSLGDGTTTDRSSPVPVSGSLSFRSLNLGGAHACGQTVDGALYCWGANPFGQLGDGTTASRLSPVPAASGFSFQTLSLGTQYSCGVTPAAATYCWGYNGQGQLGDGTTANRLTPTLAAPAAAAALAAIRAGDTPIDPQQAAAELLGTPSLSAEQKQLLDRQGNRDGTYNLGDLLAYLDAHRLELSPAVQSRLVGATGNDGTSRGSSRNVQ